MRPEPNKEIDLLLRQLARRDGAPVSEIEEQHLDADELNSYVANALPAAARARYTEHLADCSNCRKLVVQLSAAQGPVAVQQSAPAVAPSGLMSFLASLFSPMVLRYAVPALGLMVIVIVGVVVFRPEPESTSVALIENTDKNKSVLQSPTPQASVESDKPVAKRSVAEPGLVGPSAQEAAAPVVANQPADTDAVAAEPPPPAAPKTVATETEAQSKAEAQPKAETQKEKKAETTDRAAETIDVVKQRADDAAKERVQKLHEGVAIPGASVERRDVRPAKPAQGAGTGAVANASPTAGREYNRARDENTSRDGVSDKERNEARARAFSSETRSVAGRRFRKSGSVWIDTAYNSSAEITTVARGSEQYRALVADEPSIRTIAEELDGEIIVVWKRRTYRIR